MNPGRSRRCEEENALSLPLSLDGKANADDDSKSEDLPCIEVREATSDRPHAVLLCDGKRMKAFPPGRFFCVSGMKCSRRSVFVCLQGQPWRQKAKVCVSKLMNANEKR